MSMLMAGAMAIYSGSDRYQLRMSMLGGLLHDIGELYIQPDYLTSDAPDPRGLATHLRSPSRGRHLDSAANRLPGRTVTRHL